MDKRCWVILYSDNTYEELYDTEKAARGIATERQKHHGGSYRIIEW